jgi:hypothetical protein
VIGWKVVKVAEDHDAICLWPADALSTHPRLIKLATYGGWCTQIDSGLNQQPLSGVEAFGKLDLTACWGLLLGLCLS